MKLIRNVLALGAVFAVAAACGGSGEGGAAAPDGESADKGGKPAKFDGDPAAKCGPDALIDDCEDNNNQGAVAGGRGGYWYTYVDEAGSSIDPTAGSQGGTFVMTEGGAKGSAFGACMRGTMGGGGVVYAGMGVNFTDPKDVYDGSQYGGIAFYAKAAAPTKIKVKIPDANTDQDAGRCSACFNDFGVDLTLTTDWQRYVVPFANMKQEPGWGEPKAGLSSSEMTAIQFQVKTPGVTYDVCVDNIEFTGCAAE